MLQFKRKSFRLYRQLQCLLLSFSLVYTLQAGAEALPEGPPEELPEPEILFPELFQNIDAPRDYLSAKIAGLASNIDRFFGDERNFQESNQSLLQLDFVKVAGYGGTPNVVFSGRAKLHLPNTEKRLHLMVETDSEKNVTGDTTQDKTVLQDKVSAPEKVSLAARFERKEEKRWYFSTDAGIQFKSPLEPFTRARGSYSFPFELWRAKVTETIFWFNTIGAGATSQLDFERSVAENQLFRASSNATWLHEKQNFDLNQVVSLYQTINSRSALQYQAGAFGVTHPQGQITDCMLSILYRYRVHRNWIFFELNPQIHYPRDKNYQYSPAFSMRLEILFDGSR